MRSNHPICGPPRRAFWVVGVSILVLASGSAALAQWVNFEDQTDQRISALPERAESDGEEKDYAWGDLDLDGDTDMVVVRKQIQTTSGKRINFLFLNQSGVLTDRTEDFATATDVPGDEGFLTPTNDRDVAIADLNNDGWPEVITVTAVSNGEPKHIGHPRVYMNQCCAVGGCAATSCSTEDWLGLKFENDRIPQLLADNGQNGFNPCFCSVSAGDVNEDGYNDLWFVDYDTNCGAADFNDKLLLNRGDDAPGFFIDVTETNFVGGGSGFPVSGFGASGDIRKMNEDDHLDLVKQFAGSVKVGFNDPDDLGVIHEQTNPYGGAAYFVSVGELNNDGRLDMVVSDDGQDRYLLNQGDGADDIADFISFSFQYEHQDVGGDSGDDGFGGNSLVADLDQDGWGDVIITDIDVDAGGCAGRRTHIFRNLAGAPGSSVVLEEQTNGSGCEPFAGNPASCLVASIPANMLKQVHDVAVFDINGDTWPDMVLGRCNSTEVYVNIPPFPPAGSVPDGDGTPGTMLTVDRTGSTISVSWGASCQIDDTDYAVYRGTIGDFKSHSPVTCSTGGATTHSFLDSPGNHYFLATPLNQVFQGSMGRTSEGKHRHGGLNACQTTSIGNCL